MPHQLEQPRLFHLQLLHRLKDLTLRHKSQVCFIVHSYSRNFVNYIGYTILEISYFFKQLLEPCFDNDAQYKGEAVKKPGKKYKLTNILSALDCQQKCHENPKCEYFTWNAGTGPGRWNTKNRNTCWLKKNKGNVRRSSKDAGKISGKKEC